MTEFGQTFTNGTSQAFAHVDLCDPHVPVVITFHFAQPLQITLIEVQDHTQQPRPPRLRPSAMP